MILIKSEDYFLVSLALLVALLVAVWFGAAIEPYRYADVEGLILATFEMVCAFLGIGFFVSGIIKRIVEVRRSKAELE